MPVTTRKRKAPTPTPKAKPAAQKAAKLTSSSAVAKTSRVEYKDDDPFYEVFDESESESESEESDYGRKRRKKAKSTIKKRKGQKKAPGPAPLAPDISDDDFGVSDDDSLLSTKAPTTGSKTTFGASPSVLSIRIPASGSLTTLNLNLSDLLGQRGGQFDFGSLATPTPAIVNETIISTTNNRLTTTGFLSLPKELRDKVYGYLLIANSPILFHRRQQFQRSAQFLSTCRTVAAEGTTILYGQNSFHFERTRETRGTYRDQVWKEVGFKDVRRFLNDIGHGNISKVKYVSFELEDAAAYLTPYLKSQAERQFVNDPVLLEIFNMIGANTMLRRLAIRFAGRTQVQANNLHFLRALSRMKCNEFYHAKGYGGGRIEASALSTLKSVIVIKKATGEEIDEAKVKNKVLMCFEKPDKEKFTKTW